MPKALDQIDCQIVAMLQNDGRTATVEIARELGLAEGTVRKRIERLLDAEVMRVTAVVDPSSVDRGTRIVIGVEANLPQAKQVAEQLAAMPEVYAVSLVTGTYDVLVEVVLSSPDELLPFLMDKVAVMPGVKRTETCQVLKSIKRPADWAIPAEWPRGPGSKTAPAQPHEVIPGKIIVPSS